MNIKTDKYIFSFIKEVLPLSLSLTLCLGDELTMYQHVTWMHCTFWLLLLLDYTYELRESEQVDWLNTLRSETWINSSISW